MQKLPTEIIPVICTLTCLLPNLVCGLVHISFGSAACQSSIWWQGSSSEQLQNGFSWSFCTCSMPFQRMKNLASACSAGTLEWHWRSQIALETLLANATGHSKERNRTLHRDTVTLAFSSLVLPCLGSDMLPMLSISICKTRCWDLRGVVLLICVKLSRHLRQRQGVLWHRIIQSLWHALASYRNKLFKPSGGFSS